MNEALDKYSPRTGTRMKAYPWRIERKLATGSSKDMTGRAAPSTMRKRAPCSSQDTTGPRGLAFGHVGGDFNMRATGVAADAAKTRR